MTGSLGHATPSIDRQRGGEGGVRGVSGGGEGGRGGCQDGVGLMQGHPAHAGWAAVPQTLGHAPPSVNTGGKGGEGRGEG
jgi:hypothetical protein